MYDDEPYMGIGKLLAYFGIIILFILVFGTFMYIVILPTAQQQTTTTETQHIFPQTTTTETQHIFAGELSTITKDASWFGLGAPHTTTLTFINGTGTADFTFPDDLTAKIGEHYQVTYNQTVTIYITNENTLFGFSYRNNTSIEALEVKSLGIIVPT